MKPTDPDQPEAELCPTCGSLMVTEDGKTTCAKCDGEIDWGLEEDEDE